MMLVSVKVDLKLNTYYLGGRHYNSLDIYGWI